MPCRVSILELSRPREKKARWHKVKEHRLHFVDVQLTPTLNDLHGLMVLSPSDTCLHNCFTPQAIKRLEYNTDWHGFDLAKSGCLPKLLALPILLERAAAGVRLNNALSLT